MTTPTRGEIWLVDWDQGRGSEQNEIRPSLIIQTDRLNHNENYTNTLIIAISTSGREIPFHIKVNPDDENGLTSISFIKCEQILTTAKQRLIKKLGTLSFGNLKQVETALLKVLDFTQ